MRIHFFATALLAGMLANELATAKEHHTKSLIQNHLHPGFEKQEQHDQATLEWQKELATGLIEP